MAQNADKIITVSYAMQEDLVKHGWAPSKISVVWNGVDPETYNPAHVAKKRSMQSGQNTAFPTAGTCCFSWEGLLG